MSGSSIPDQCVDISSPLHMDCMSISCQYGPRQRTSRLESNMPGNQAGDVSNNLFPRGVYTSGKVEPLFATCPWLLSGSVGSPVQGKERADESRLRCWEGENGVTTVKTGAQLPPWSLADTCLDPRQIQAARGKKGSKPLKV